MPIAVVLGGCGAVGRFAVRTLVAEGGFDQVVVADLDLERAREFASELDPARVAVARVDAGDVASVRQAIHGSQVVVNCTGPFYRFARPVMQAVLAERVPYVDVCDDVDATLDLLSLDPEVRAASIPAVMGMGNSPGVTNILAKFASDQLLDEVEAVDIFHAHGGEPFEGIGVIAHRFHGMTLDIPMYLDGELKYVHFFEPDGLALRERVDFHLVGRGVMVYPYPHPEQLTLPRHVRCRRVTNRGTVLPDEYFQLTCELARLGFDSRQPVVVDGQPVTPHDFAMAYLQRERDVILERTGFGTQRGCAMVVVKGVRHGKPRTYRFSMASQSQALGEGTGIPAGMGAILVRDGKVKGVGVLPPEAAFDPLDVLGLVPSVLERMQKSGGGFEGFLIEKVDENGQVERVDLPI
jgi:saccharopine dehydrogenase (NAD+, L-lysine-forming)